MRSKKKRELEYKPTYKGLTKQTEKQKSKGQKTNDIVFRTLGQMLDRYILHNIGDKY